MLRTLIILLFLAVFFLSGMIFGMDNGHEAEQAKPQEESTEEVQENQVETSVDTKNDEETIEVVDDPALDTEEDGDKFTQKSATFLGSVIQGFYEIVITVFYQFAQLFF